MQASEKKRPREERDIIHRLRPFAKLQTAEDYEIFAADILCTTKFLVRRDRLTCSKMRLSLERGFWNFKVIGGLG